MNLNLNQNIRLQDTLVAHTVRRSKVVVARGRGATAGGRTGSRESGRNRHRAGKRWTAWTATTESMETTESRSEQPPRDNPSARPTGTRSQTSATRRLPRKEAPGGTRAV